MIKLAALMWRFRPLFPWWPCPPPAGLEENSTTLNFTIVWLYMCFLGGEINPLEADLWCVAMFGVYFLFQQQCWNTIRSLHPHYRDNPVLLGWRKVQSSKIWSFLLILWHVEYLVCFLWDAFPLVNTEESGQCLGGSFWAVTESLLCFRNPFFMD